MAGNFFSEIAACRTSTGGLKEKRFSIYGKSFIPQS
jgi:hypothetical protein